MITSHRRRYDVILAPNAHWDIFLFFFFFYKDKQPLWKKLYLLGTRNNINCTLLWLRKNKRRMTDESKRNPNPKHIPSTEGFWPTISTVSRVGRKILRNWLSSVPDLILNTRGKKHETIRYHWITATSYDKILPMVSVDKFCLHDFS